LVGEVTTAQGPDDTTPPKNSGRTDGWLPADKAEHATKCPIYGHMNNMRDLAEVLEHAGLHQAPAENLGGGSVPTFRRKPILVEAVQ
jgi:hypothetical protein